MSDTKEQKARHEAAKKAAVARIMADFDRLLGRVEAILTDKRGEFKNKEGVTK
jgi:hypothetical protein